MDRNRALLAGLHSPLELTLEQDIELALCVRGLLAYPPERVAQALQIALRLLRGCSSPQGALDRLTAWTWELSEVGRELTRAELEAVSVVRTMTGEGGV
jgi:hypothetical protein